MHGFRGIHVVDLTSHVAGPYCTKLLADAGASVIKVESAAGDPLRSWSATGADLKGNDGALFQFLNASKRSVIGAHDDDVIKALIANADLLVEDLGPASSLDRAALRKAHPNLVLLSLSPYGLTGP